MPDLRRESGEIRYALVLPSAGSRNQGCVLFVFGSQRGDAEFAEVRGDIDFVLCDSPRSRRLRDKNYNIISLKWH